MAYYSYFSPTTHTASGFNSTSDLPKSYDLDGSSYANIKTKGNGTSTLSFNGLTQFAQSEYTTHEYGPLYTLSTSSYQYMPENAIITGITAWCFPYSWAISAPTFTVNIIENGNIVSSNSKTGTSTVKISTSISYDTALKHDINWLKNSIGFSLIQKGNYSLSTSTVNSDLHECYIIVEWVPTYTITVNATAGGTVTGGGTYESGKTVTLTATPNTGYRFVKWSDGNTSATRTITVTADATYTATFERDVYYIEYDNNGATSDYRVPGNSGIVGEDIILSAIYNRLYKRYNVTLNPNYSGASTSTLVSEATFKGWEDHGNITVSEGTNKGEYFTWEQFDAPYYANTYSDIYSAFKYNKQKLVNHYANYGRSEGRKGTGTPRGVYPDGGVVNSLCSNGGETCMLYAQWSAMPAVTLPKPTRSGYSFLGWYTAASGGNKVSDGGSYTPTANITLYAHWGNEKINKIYVGTSQSKSIYIGTSEAKSIYVGTTKVYG